MIRPARTIATVLLAASFGVTGLGATAASAADAPPAGGNCSAPSGDIPNSFLPPANPGEILGSEAGHVHIRNPNDNRRDQWVKIFSYVGGTTADEIAGHLNDAMSRAERRFDRNGKGDTSDTSENTYFRTQKFSNGYGVVSTGGGVVAVYDSEDKANAVANALDDEAEEQAEEHGVDGADPCVAPDLDPRDDERRY